MTGKSFGRVSNNDLVILCRKTSALWFSKAYNRIFSVDWHKIKIIVQAYEFNKNMWSMYIFGIIFIL